MDANSFRVGALVLLSLCVSGWDGPGRFGKQDRMGKVGAAVDQVRELIKPVYEVRGALFQLRAQLVAATATSEEVAAIEPFLKLPPAEAGWVAQQLEYTRGRSGKAESQAVVQVGNAFARRQGDTGPIKRTFRDLVKVESMRASVPLQLDGSAVAGVVGDGERRSGVVKASERLVGAAKHSVTALQKAPSAAKGVARAVNAAIRTVSKAAKGNGDAVVGALVEGLEGYQAVQMLIADLDALPSVVAAIEREGATLTTAMKGLVGQIPELGGGASLGAIKLELPSDMVGTLLNALHGRLEDAEPGPAPDLSALKAIRAANAGSPPPAAPPAVGGCTKDTDCKGRRVCNDGRCVAE